MDLTEVQREMSEVRDRIRATRDVAEASRLLSLQHGVFDHLTPEPPDHPDHYDDPFPDQPTATWPEIPVNELDANILGGCLEHHGGLHVRGFFSADHVARLCADIDEAFDSRNDPDASCRRAFKSPSDYWEPGINALANLGMEYTTHYPLAWFDLLEAFDSVGFDKIIAEYMGEPVLLTDHKSAIRRLPRDVAFPTPWHQDGSWFGAGSRLVNVWAALSEIGIDAPSLEVVPLAFDRVLRVDPPWPIPHKEVLEAAAGVSPVMFELQPGDALIFDEMTVHRTGITDSMTELRYGCDTWFYPLSSYPPGIPKASPFLYSVPEMVVSPR